MMEQARLEKVEYFTLTTRASPISQVRVKFF